MRYPKLSARYSLLSSISSRTITALQNISTFKMLPILLLPLFAALSQQTNTLNNPCPPLIGGGFPPASSLSQSNAIRKAQKSFPKVLSKAISSGTTPYGKLDSVTSSFSINVFSGDEDMPLFSHHYAAPGLNGSLTSGTLDDNTLRRIGSVSKLLSMYTFLLGAGESALHDPVSKYVPELAGKENSDSVLQFNWDEITVGAVASHLSGMPKDINIQDFSTQRFDPVSIGLPVLPKSKIPTCEANPLQPPCSREEFFKHLTDPDISPLGLPFHTPEYSNAGYLLLGYIFEGITGKTMEDTFHEKIAKPLGLSRTSYHPPPSNSSNVIIPGGDPLTSTWSWDLGDASVAGGMYSTASDLVKIGRSMLSSSLLPPAVTKRWMKPTSHTANPFFSTGLVWEIHRFEIPISGNSRAKKTVDMYTKTGNMGPYTAVMILDPEHNFGYTIMLAGSDGPNQLSILSELVAKTWVQAAEEAAREEAMKFVGIYSSASSSPLNDSLTISMAPETGGLTITSYISNSTDILSILPNIIRPKPVAGQKIAVSLYHTGLKSAEKVAFRAFFEALPQEKIADRFSQNCASWGKLELQIYGNIGLDDFVFITGENGQVTEVIPRVLRRGFKRV